MDYETNKIISQEELNKMGEELSNYAESLINQQFKKISNDMDYEKKYKQLHKFISDLYPFMSEYCKEKVEGFLPELCESEDEKIRKGLINGFNECLKNSQYSNNAQKYWHNIKIEDIFAWLEKQGSEPNWCHHKVDLSNCSEEYRKAYYDGWNNCNQQHSQCKSEWNDVVKCLINGMKFYYEDNEEATWGTEKFSMKVKDILAWLEKQGGQTDKIVERAKTERQRVLITESNGEANIDWDTRSLQDAKLLLEYGLDYVNKLEKQGKQKPILDFNADDWYVSKVDGKIHNIYHSVDKVEPKFKVGDWVVSPNGVYWHIDAIQNGRYEVTADTGQCGNWPLDTNIYRLWTIQDAKDGDVLSNGKMIVIFKHFEEPSYRQHIVAYIGLDIIGNIQITDDTWNLGIDKTKPATKEQRDLLFQKIKEVGYEWDAEKKELEKQGEQRAAWSEEDETKLKSACALIKNTSLNGNEGIVDSTIDWLKSLKDRVQHQDHWKPSDEQMEALFVLLPTVSYGKNPAFSLYNDLKKLKGE